MKQNEIQIEVNEAGSITAIKGCCKASEIKQHFHKLKQMVKGE